MKISRHKGVEADQSHNYTIECTRSELKDLDSVLSSAIEDDTLDDNTIDRYIEIQTEIAKYIE